MRMHARRLGILVLLPVLMAACAPESAAPGSSSAPTPTREPTPSAPAPSPTAPSPSATAAACRGEPEGPITYRYLERPGVDAELTSLDLYLPAGCGSVPAVVWVHGGGWRAGDKQGQAIERKMELVTGLGAALVSVNYRLSTPGSGVVWPDHGVDVAAAVAWVVTEGPALGLDPDRVAVMGHSAGAHLVSIVATHPTLLADAGVSPRAVGCVVSLDTEGYDVAARIQGPTVVARELYLNAFGADPAAWADASPLLQVSQRDGQLPELLVVTRGSAERRAMSAGMVAAFEAAGGVATLIDAGAYSHQDVNVLLGAPGEQVLTPPVVELLGRCLGLSSS